MKNRTNLAVGFSAVALLVALITLIYTTVTDEPGNHDVAWNVYQGDLKTTSADYNVHISESDRGYGFNQIVHLTFPDQPIYVGITGHDYDGDGKWDAIFYCGANSMVDSKNSGCNSVRRTKSGWKFEPCPSDEGKVQPFSTEAIAFAITELDSAMKQVHNETHVVSKWVWDYTTQIGKYVFKRST